MGSDGRREQPMTPISRAALPILTLFVFALVVIAGCSESPSSPAETTVVPPPTSIPVPTPTPINVEDLLRRSGEAMSQLNTFHFRLEHNDEGSTPFSDTLDVTEAEGDVVSPDRISISFSGRFGGRFAMRASLITIGDDSYMTNPLTGNWEEVAAEVSPLGFFDPQEGIGAMMTGLRNPTLSSKDGSEFRVEGDLDVQALRPLLGTVIQDGIVRVEVTLDSDTLYLKKAVIEGRATAEDPDGVIRTITLSQHNESISITAPDTG